MEKTCTLYFVIPCYNEEEVLFEIAKRLSAKLGFLCKQNKISENSRIVFVDDGSHDRTWDIISSFHEKDKRFRGIKLSRNRGHQNALLAGLMSVKDECDAVISMDADLQDDIDASDEMIELWKKGNDIVYGVRSSRKKDGVLKRMSARAYYRLLSFMGVEVVYDHADYRLLSKRALDGLAEFKEVNLFLRGIVPMIGYNTAKVTYERGERFAGKSKYPLKKMLKFAWEGISSLSIRPIRMITALGFLIFGVSIIMLSYFLIRHFSGATVPGWTSIAVSVWAIGGLQLLAIGIIGEYIGKMYLETKRRPRYIIEKYLK